MHILFTGVWDLNFAATVENSLAEFLPIASKYKLPTKITVNISSGLLVCAGKAMIRRDLIKLNHRLLKDHTKEIRDTFGHELAHFLEYWQYGTVGHGIVWKSIMVELGLPPNRTHDLDVNKLHTTFKYECLCQEHSLSLRKHNAILLGKSERQCI